jgi:exonuclease 1
VAPHEADAQLAYLNQQGIANVIITEDSDLILFGCSQVWFATIFSTVNLNHSNVKILYKMDINGNGLLLRADKLHLTLGRPHESPENLLIKLRQLCILSGCDYVSSLPGVGLVKAKKFVMACSDPDFLHVIY